MHCFVLPVGNQIKSNSVLKKSKLVLYCLTLRYLNYDQNKKKFDQN